MKYFPTSALIFLSFINPTFGDSECPREKAAKEHIIRYMKQTTNAHDLIVGSSTIKNPKEQTCTYEIFVTFKELIAQGKEQIYMEYFQMNDDFVLLRDHMRFEAERIKD